MINSVTLLLWPELTTEHIALLRVAASEIDVLPKLAVEMSGSSDTDATVRSSEATSDNVGISPSGDVPTS